MKESILARDLMSRPVRRLTASTPVRDAAAFLLRHGISGAPVSNASRPAPRLGWPMGRSRRSASTR